MKTVNVIAICIAVLVSAAATVYGAASSSKQTEWSAIVDGNGNMHVPDGYRTKYQFLGTWVVAGEGQAAKELHVVYASPGVVDEYRNSKQFADGAVLVKEVFQAH